jgi:hypothetical protein
MYVIASGESAPRNFRFCSAALYTSGSAGALQSYSTASFETPTIVSQSSGGTLNVSRLPSGFSPGHIVFANF